MQVRCANYFAVLKVRDMVTASNRHPENARMTPEEALKAALQIVGGPVALARAISTRKKKITSQAISFWKVCPAKWADEVYEAVRAQRAIQAPSRRQLCPDVSRETPAPATPAPGRSASKTGTPRKRR